MLEILLLFAVFMIGAAKRPAKRRSRGRFRVVRVQFNISLGTLASGTMLSQTLGIGTGQEYWAISADIVWTLEDLTVGQGPIAVGIAHGDYSVTELDEWYEATGTLAGDKTEQEEGRRLARDVGIFPGSTVGPNPTVLNDGKAIRTKIGMRIEDAISLNAWVRNMSADALATTVPTVRGFGKVYLNLL